MNFLEEALKPDEPGYLVFPCEPNGKIPFSITAPHGCHSTASDPAIIRRWRTQYPDCNIGVKCGNMQREESNY